MTPQIIWDGPEIAFGVQDARPIDGLPEGAKVKLRMRADDFTQAYVRTATETSCHYIDVSSDGKWILGQKTASNLKLT